MTDDFEARIDAQLLRAGEPRALATPTPVPSLSGIEEAIMDAIDDYRDSLPCTKYGPLEWPTVEGMKEAVRTGLRAALSATATEGK